MCSDTAELDMVPNCDDCDKRQRVEYDNGCFCAAIVRNPLRLCDELRLCQQSGNEIVFSIDLAPDEVTSIITVLSGVLGDWLTQKQPRPCSKACSQYESCIEIAEKLKHEAPGSSTGGS